MNATELASVLKDHAMYLCGTGGVRANLYEANLRGANLCGANLCEANLRGANLCEADLREANLRGANLCEADLCGANLRGANLYGADLYGADLYGANLCGANLYGADLCGTVLGPDNAPSGAGKEFARDGDFVVGFRTRKAGHIDQYRAGRCYSADVFSTCPDTECHPGLYLWPTLAAAREWMPGDEIIRVRTKPSEVHKAGNKWRCRWFEVLGAVEG